MRIYADTTWFVYFCVGAFDQSIGLNGNVDVAIGNDFRDVW